MTASRLGPRVLFGVSITILALIGPLAPPALGTSTQQLRITPTALEFGPVQVGATSPSQTVTITNISAAPIVMSGAGGAPANGDFNGVQDCQGQTLAVGASCHMFFTYTPGAVGPETSASIGSWNGQAFNIALTGTGVAPQFRIAAAALDFGSVAVGVTSPSQTVTITNIGLSPVVMSGAGGAPPNNDFNGVQDCQGQTLAVGASCHMFFTFTPSAAGPSSSASIGNWNGQGFNIPLAGKGVAPQFRISPTGLDFGPVQVGSNSPSQTVTITNVGPSSVVMSGAGGAPPNNDFNASQDCQGQTLAVGASCHMFFTFNPSAAGSASSTSSGSWNGQAFNIALAGNGLTDIGTNTQLFRVTPSALDFGPVQLGQTSPSQTVTITNISSAAVVMSGAGGAPPGDFNGVQDCQGQTLAVGASCHMFFTFTPSAAGAASSASIGSWNGQGFNIPMTGKGVAPQFNISPSAVDFGPVQTGTTSPQQTITITNVGLSPVVMSGAGGAPPGDFNGVQDCQGKTLAVGASCHMFFTFSPTTTGAATSASIGNWNGVPFNIPLKGTGVAPQFRITPTGLDFGPVQVGTTAPQQTVTITNVGLSSVVMSGAGGAPPNGDFNGVQDCQGQTLAVGASCHMFFTFTPSAAGAETSASIGNWNGQAFNIALSGNGLDNAPPDTTIDSGPANPTTSASATFTFSGTDDLTPAASLTFECSLDGATFASCASPSAYTGLTPGSHTFRVRAIDGSANVDPTPASFTWQIQAPTSVLYNGTQIVNVGGSFQPAAKLSSTASACIAGQTVSFSLDRNPLTGTAGSYALATAATNSSGQATATSISTAGWIEGVYDITARFAGTASCVASQDVATLTIATPGDAATGGGWYTLSGTGRNNFGFTVRKVDPSCLTSCAYKGSLVLVNNGKWRLKGTLSAYSTLSTGAGAASGTGDLYWWNASLNGGLGDWALAQSGVAFTANFFDSRKTGKASTDTFGIRITYTPVAPQPSSLPNSTPQLLKGGDIKVSP